MNDIKRLQLLFVTVLLVTILPAHSALGLNEVDQGPSFDITEVSFVMSGTSNVRDWEIGSDKMTGSVILGPAFFNGEEGMDQWFEEILLYVPNKSLDSGISAMNSAMHDNLKTDEHPQLTYRLAGVEEVTKAEDGESLTFRVNGVANAAGNDHQFVHDVVVSREGDGTYGVSGELDFKMTDFEIDPPTFTRGALKTQDRFSITYRLKLVPQE